MGHTERLSRGLLVAFLSIVAVLFLLPIAWWVSSAMHPTSGLDPRLSLRDTWIPDRFALLDNLRVAFDLYPMWRFFVNSVIVACSVTIGEVFLSALAGYAFAKLHFPGRDAVFGAFVVLLMVPQIVLIVPLFELAADTNSTNSLRVLIVPFLTTPFGIFLMRQFMQAIPDSYLEAARLEGASELRVFCSVALPLARNALVTLAVITFMLQWDSLLWPLIANSDQNHFTLPVGVSLLQTNVQVPYNAIYAVTLVLSLPLLVAFLCLQRLFMRSLAMTGLKG